MWPWRPTSGWYRLDRLADGRCSRRRSSGTGRRFADRPRQLAGRRLSRPACRQVSIGVSFGGQWRLNTHRPTSGTAPTARVDRRRDLVLARLARRVPRRDRGQADRDHRVLVVQVDHPALARDDAGRRRGVRARRAPPARRRCRPSGTGARRCRPAGPRPARSSRRAVPTPAPGTAPAARAGRPPPPRTRRGSSPASRSPGARRSSVNAREPVPLELVIAPLEVRAERRRSRRTIGTSSLAHEVAAEHERVGVVERRRRRGTCGTSAASRGGRPRRRAASVAPSPDQPASYPSPRWTGAAARAAPDPPRAPRYSTGISV